MVAPLVLAGTTAANHATGFLFNQVNAFLGPQSRRSTYAGNRGTPNLLPDFATIIRLANGGVISANDANYILACHGINGTIPTPGPRGGENYWNKIIDSGKGWWDNDLYRLWRRRGLISNDELEDVLRRQGFDPSLAFNSSGSSEVQSWIDNSEPLPWSVVLDQYNRGFFIEVTARQLLTEAGITDTDTQSRILDMTRPIDLVASIALRNRNKITQEEFIANVVNSGYRRVEDVAAMDELRKNLPSPSDLILFSVREVWDQSIVDAFGYDEEFPAPFAYWMKQQGFDWTEDVQNEDGTTTPGVNWPKAWWRSHWQTISPGQAYEMLHRLRPNRIADYQDIAPGVKAFTIDDVRKVLKIADYPKAFRDALAAISYRPIGIRQIRSLVANGLWGVPELTEGFQDLGYSPSNSATLADMSIRESDTRRLKQLQSGQRGRVVKGYETGLISRNNAAIQLYLLAVASRSEYNDFVNQPEAAQIQQATTDPVVRSTLDGIDTDVAVKLSDQAIAAIKASYIRYEIDDSQAKQYLDELGLQITRINQYLDYWQWQRFRRGKSLAIAQVNKLLVRGIISPPDYLQRLQLLGYQPVDALALLNLTLQDSAAYIARAQEKLARTQSQQQKALIAQQRQVKQQLKDLRSQLAYNAPVGKLKKWLAKGLIGKAEASMRMAALGHNAEFIANEINDATSKLEYTAKKPAQRILETPLPPDTTRAGSG